MPQTTWHNFYIFYRVGNPKKSDPDSSPGTHRQQGGKGEGGEEGESGQIWKWFPFWKNHQSPRLLPQPLSLSLFQSDLQAHLSLEMFNAETKYLRETG